MATDFGTDLRALDDLPPSDDYVSGEENVAYAAGRRFLTPTGGYADCGDPTPYQSIDIREQLGTHLSTADEATLSQEAAGALSQDERVLTVDSTIERQGRVLVAIVEGETAEGPFSLVLRAPPDSAVTMEIT